MKKIKLLILISLATHISFAQQEFNISYSAGINYFIPENENMFNKDISKIDFPFTVHPKISKNFDLTLSYQILKKISFGTGLGLNGRAAKFENLVLNYDSENTYKAKSKINFTYLKFPLFLEYNFLKNKSLTPYVHAEFSYNKMQCVREEIISVKTVGTDFLFKNYILTLNPQLNNYKNNNFIEGAITVGIKYFLFKKLYIGINGGINLSKFIKTESKVRLSGKNYKTLINFTVIL